VYMYDIYNSWSVQCPIYNLMIASYEQNSNTEL
jgi:hypothetical protein